MVDLTGRAALVTGASRGIGAATVRALAAAGASVAAVARNGAACAEVAEQATADGGRAVGLTCDVADPAVVAAVAAEAAERLGPIDILVNNAGMIEPIGGAADAEPEAWMHNLRVNLGGAYACVHALLPGMLAAGGGTVVNISGGAAHNPLEGWSAYCSAKAGLAMLTRCLDLEYGAAGLRVFGFGPGVVDTEMQVQVRASGINRVSQLARSDLAPPERPARAIAWLCGRDSDDLAGGELSIRDPELQRRAGLESA